MNESFKDLVRSVHGDYVAWSMPYLYTSDEVRYKLVKGKVRFENYVVSCSNCVLCTNSNNLFLDCKKISNFREVIGKKEVIYTNVSKDFPDLNFDRDNLFIITRSILFILVAIFLFRFLGSLFRRS